MQEKNTRDWDDAFANMAYVKGSDSLPSIWSQDAMVYRSSGIRVEEFTYGNEPREAFDIIWPDSRPRGLAVFVHGGYWMKFDKSYWTHFAEGARSRGWAVCLPAYTLAPEIRIRQITKQIGAAIQMAASHVEGPIRLAGHSAGGHLVSRMVCDDTPLATSVSKRIEHTLSISGLHDLRPLLNTTMNKTLQLDMPEASLESAVLHLPCQAPHITAWVGGAERPEFIRQAQLWVQMWDGLGASTACIVDAEHNHFSVIENLKDSNSELCNCFVGNTENAPATRS